jgi:hypothetical protein
MFSSSSYKMEQKRLPVIISTTDGRELVGSLLISRDKSLLDTMNGPDMFVELDTAENGIMLVAKTSLTSVAINAAPNVESLDINTSSFDDPYSILGLPQTADYQIVQETYRNFIKVYHPDRFSGIDLPDEVQDYIEGMMVRFNWAHDEIRRRRNAGEARSSGPIRGQHAHM